MIRLCLKIVYGTSDHNKGPSQTAYPITVGGPYPTTVTVDIPQYPGISISIPDISIPAIPTPTIPSFGHGKREAEPEPDLTNAERLARGLPLKRPDLNRRGA